MPSHFSSIGLPVADNQELTKLLEKLWSKTSRIRCKSGSYAVWNSESGASLWLQLDKNDQLVRLTPFFNGNSEVTVGITSQVTRNDDTTLEGAIYGWADPVDGNPDDGAYPFVFDYLNFGQLPKLKCPTIRKVRLVAFAHQLAAFPTEESYYSTQTDEPGFASKSFIPSGTFTPDTGKKETPTSEAIFTGHIVDSKRLTNELTNATFTWIQVEAVGGTFDVVADNSLIGSVLVIGGVISGSFYLCGQIKLERRSIFGNFV